MSRPAVALLVLPGLLGLLVLDMAPDEAHAEDLRLGPLDTGSLVSDAPELPTPLAQVNATAQHPILGTPDRPRYALPLPPAAVPVEPDCALAADAQAFLACIQAPPLAQPSTEVTIETPVTEGCDCLPARYQIVLDRHRSSPAPDAPVAYEGPEVAEPAEPATAPSQQDAAPGPRDRTVAVLSAAVLPASLTAALATLPWDRGVAWAKALPWRRLLALLPLAGLYSRLQDDDLLENETRRGIHERLQAEPGRSIQELRDGLGIAWGTAVYHLERLERAGVVISHRHGNHRRYFVQGSQEARNRAGLAVLHAVTARRLARAVMDRPGASQSDLCEQLGIRGPAACKHLKRMEEHLLVRSARNQRFRVYEPTSRLRELAHNLDDRP